MAPKTFNLTSLTHANNDFSPEILKDYLTKLEGEITPSEVNDLSSLVEKIKSITRNKMIFCYYYIGFKIKQIGKEFDLLRLGSNYHINIELKREHTGEAIQKQLIKNKYYLNSLGSEVFYFTYVADEEKLYYLENDDSITEVDIKFLIDKIRDQDILEIEDLNSLFDPTIFLVSPFNSTKKFIKNEYFLTNHQSSIKEQLQSLSLSSQNKLFSIEGAAGTGKTLLVYDIVKQYRNEGKKVTVLHCGNLNDGHNELINKYGWRILPVKKYKDLLSEQLDVILIDEAQRIRKYQLEEIIEYATKHQITCIFSLDPKQCLSEIEIENKIHEYLNPIVNKPFKLTQKIRTNPEISSFVKNLFSRSNRTAKQKYKNVELQYFSNIDEARSFIKMLEVRGWTAIDYTVSRYKESSLDNMTVLANDNAHSVIGQEFDNVVSVIGNTFCYNSDGKLVGDKNAYYHPTQMLFQILTRTRKKLYLIIVDNEEILKECLKIIG
ncbi:DNA/RNA helicase domain-containing protein [Bacillus albus]|uniref:DNA/RNA helicase domain-containing protein n=1 Tax=Bacillus albus TaxID=2026189 RepID=UPI0032C469E4